MSINQIKFIFFTGDAMIGAYSFRMDLQFFQHHLLKMVAFLYQMTLAPLSDVNSPYSQTLFSSLTYINILELHIVLINVVIFKCSIW